MGFVGKLVIGAIGFAVGSQLKPETRTKVGEAVKAVGDDLTRRIREKGTQVRRFFEEEVLTEIGSKAEQSSPKAPAGPDAAPATPAQA